VELVYACEEALRIVDAYEPPDPPALALPGMDEPVAGAAATEAPRGLLMHRYEIEANGLVRKARIMPPTSQNQLSIEADLRRVAENGLDLSHDELTRRAELAVRNHDPCISCATHFLDVTVETKP
jgi:coenzyme F420-reducing hydrogenase alpha subunit